MIPLSKAPLTYFENIFKSTNMYTQLAIRTQPNYVKDIVDEIAHKAMGCRVSMDDKYMYSCSDKCPIFNIPNDSCSLKELIEKNLKNIKVPTEQRLASIGYNNNSIILNIHHAIADGGYLKMLASHIEGKSNIPDNFDPLPEFPHDTYYQGTLKASGIADQHTTEFPTTTYLPEFIGQKPSFRYFSLPMAEISTQKPGVGHSITEMLYSTMILVASSYSNEFKKAAIKTCMNLRDRVAKASWNNCNTFTSELVNAKGISINSTIGEMQHALREDLDNRLKTQEYFKFLRNLREGTVKGMDYIGIELSNCGVFPTGNLIKEIYIDMDMTSVPGNPGDVNLTTYSAAKTFYGSIRFPRSAFNDSQMDRISRQFLHCIKNMPPSNTKISDALKIIRKIE